MDKDIKFIVGPEEVIVQASSQVMAAASPVFRQMFLRDRFAEGTSLHREGALDLRLEDDNADAFRALCAMFHNDIPNVPTPGLITSEVFMDMANMIDKYDCADAVQPWPQMWQKELERRFESPSLSESMDWIHISYHLRCADIFKARTSFLIRHDEESSMVLTASEFEILPRGVNEAIIEKRKQAVKALRDGCVKFIEQIEQDALCYKSPADERETFDCRSIQVGNFILAFQDKWETTWQDLEGQPWVNSIEDIVSDLLHLSHRFQGNRRLFQKNRRREGNGHSGCDTGPVFRARVLRVYKWSEEGLDLDHLDEPIKPPPPMVEEWKETSPYEQED